MSGPAPAAGRAPRPRPGGFAGPVGFVGLGNMGRRMAANLAAAGFALVVRDSDAGAQQRFVAGHGGEPADLAARRSPRRGSS